MKITATIPKGAGEILKGFAATGIVGSTPEEAASYLLMRALSDLVGAPGFRHLLNKSKPDK